MKYLISGSESSSLRFILAHGAGVPMDSPFMEAIAVGLADNDVRVVRFEFPYMQERRISGKQLYRWKIHGRTHSQSGGRPGWGERFNLPRLSLPSSGETGCAAY